MARIGPELDKGSATEGRHSRYAAISSHSIYLGTRDSANGLRMQTSANRVSLNLPATFPPLSTSPSPRRPTVFTSQKTNSRTALAILDRGKRRRSCSTARPGCGAGRQLGWRRRRGGQRLGSILGVGWTGLEREARLRNDHSREERAIDMLS